MRKTIPAPGFERPHLDRYLREWIADSRERESWGDADESTYRFRANVLEAALKIITEIGGGRDDQAAEREMP